MKLTSSDGSLIYRSPRCTSRRSYLRIKEHSVIDTISGIETEKDNSFRRHEDRPPPHLPLPPTLPYQPTSTPFRRHLQVLEESLLSSSPEPSWEIFTAIHEDLRRQHVPADTLRSVLAKQVNGLSHTDNKRKARWRKLHDVLTIMEENGICGRSEDLDNIIVAAIDDQGRRVTSHQFSIGRIGTVWADLASIHGESLQNISLRARERWLLFRMSQLRSEPRRTCGTDNEKFDKMRNEWHRLASKGFFRGFNVSDTYLQGFRTEYQEHVREILEMLRAVYDNFGIIPLDTLRYVWQNHLEARVRVFEPPEPQLYRFMEDISTARQTTAGGSFDAALQESLALATEELTGNVPVTALSLYLPSGKMMEESASDQISSSNLQRALDLTRRRLKHISRHPAEAQSSSIVNTLGFAALLVESAVAKGVSVSDSFVLAACRAFKYLPTKIRADPRYASRLHSALLLLCRSLRRQDNSLKQWTTVWPDMLEAISSYAGRSGKRDLLSQTIVIYRQMRSRNDPAHLETLSTFRKDFARSIIDIPWVSLELYADAVASGCAEDPDVRDLIVQRISTINKLGSLRRLRASIARDQSAIKASITISIIEDAISICKTAERALKLYDVLEETQYNRGKTANALGLLLEKVIQLGDPEQRQQAIGKVEEAYRRGERPRNVLEMFAELVEGEKEEAEVASRLKALEAGLIEGKRSHTT